MFAGHHVNSLLVLFDSTQMRNVLTHLSKSHHFTNGEPQEHQKIVSLLIKEQGTLGHECHTWHVESSVKISSAWSTGVLRNVWKQYGSLSQQSL